MLRAISCLVMVACGQGTPAGQVTDGVRMEFSTDFERLRDEETRDLARELHSWLGAANIVQAVRVDGSTIVVKPASEEVRALVKREYGNQLEEQPCSELCYRLRETYWAERRASALEQTVKVVRVRVAQTLPRAIVAVDGTTIIIDISTPELEETGAISDIVSRRAKIDLRLVDNDAPFMHQLAPKLDGIVTVATERWTSDGTEEQDVYLVARERNQLETALADLAGREPQLAPPADREFGFEHREQDWRTYYLVRGPTLGRASIKNATAGKTATVTAQLTDSAAELFEKLTADHKGSKLAIVLDSRVVSAPVINGRISGGSLTITLGTNAKQQHADELALLLRSGSLPLALRHEYTRRIEHGKVVPNP